MKKNYFLIRRKRKLFSSALVLNLFTILAFLMVCSTIFGQTTVFSEDFNRGSVVSPLSNATSPFVMTWTTNCPLTGATAGISKTNLTNGTDYALDLEAGATPTATRAWVSGPLTSYGSPFNSTLNTNSGVITWTFNMRTNRVTKLSGFGAANYGSAVVLASTAADFTTSSGYAVVMTGGTTTATNILKLVRFTSGIQGTQTSVVATTSSEFASVNFVNVKVVYNKTGNYWSLYYLDNGSSTNNTDPTTVIFTQIGTTTPDPTWTGTLMSHCGFFWNIGGTSAGSSNRGLYDNFKVVIGAPSWTINYPKADGITGNGFTARAATSAPGNVYFVVLPSGAAAPSAAQVKAGLDGNGNTLAANLKGSFAVSGGTESNTSVSGLTNLTNYDVYYIAEDNYPTLQSAVTKVSITTVVDPPTNNPTSLLFTSVTSTGMRLDFTASNAGADSYLVLRNAGSAPTGTPNGGTVYSIGQTNIGSGTNTVAYVGSATGFNETTLIGSTKYYYTIYAYNSVTTPSYQTINPLTGSQETDLIVKKATAVSTSGLTAFWYPITSADNYDINIYDAGNNLINTTNVLGQSTPTKLINQTLTPGFYTFTVTGKVGVTPIKESAKSLAIEVTAGKTLTQYMSTDITTLNTDLITGTGQSNSVDIFELITSGGAYTFSTGSTSNNNPLIKNTTIRAHSTLASRPVLKISGTSTGSTLNIINTATAALTIKFDGLEFDGGNGSTGGNPIAFTSTASDLNLTVNNCVFHSLNTSGNGALRWDGIPTNSTSQNITITNSVFNACGGRILYSNPASGASNITIRNCTFSNNTDIGTRACVLYNNSSNPGIIIVDHCTFVNIIASSGSTSDNLIRNPSGYGGMLFTNNIFSSVANTLNTTNVTISNNYLAGLGTAPNGAFTFPSSPAPVFTNAGALNFALTNKSSFICNDGYVAGNTFGAVLNPLAAPSTINDATTVLSQGFTAGWSAVTNATGYLVNVYSGATLVKSVRVITNSADITGLIANTSYSYKVIAIGDATSYSSSVESSPSTSFSTPLPVSITSFTPTIGGSGTSVVITGTNLNSASAVSFGGTAASSFTIDNDTQITAIVGSGANGSVSVTTPSGTATKSGFLWLEPVTTISLTQNATDLTLSTSSVVTVANGGMLTIDVPTNIYSISIERGGKVTNSSTLNLRNFTINSDASGTGTYVDNGTTDISGMTNVNQYLTAGRNWYISSPVTSATSNVFSASSSFPMYSYSESTGTAAPWTKITDNVTALTVTQGYIANVASSGAVTFSGTLNNGSVTSVPLNRTTGQAKEGFNLIGNPYPSYLNWNSVSNDNSGLMTTMWYRTKTAPAGDLSTSFVYDTYNANGGQHTNLGATTVSNLIPPMQAFWVRVIDGQSQATLSFTNAMRSHADVGTNSFKAPAIRNTDQQVLHLQVSNGINNDETIIYSDAAALNSYDTYDSPKLTNNNAAIPEIYTNSGGENLVINGLNSIPVNQELPLGFTTGSTNSFTLKATEVTNFDAGTKIILKDNLLNTEQDMTDGSTYSFTSDALTTTTRFSVIFKTSSIATDINNNDSDNSDILVYKNATGQITVNCDYRLVAQGALLAVFNELGQKLTTDKLSSTTTVLSNQYKQGVYFVNIIAHGNTTTRKVVIN